MKRRLAAILAADLVGYARIMHADEPGTHRRLQTLRSQLIQPRIDSHRGRTFKLMGDGLLAEFASVVDAVACAIEIQRAMAGYEEAQVEASRLQLRIGVHLGDVIIEGSDIYGDGVNIAARLEAAAEPGGICISGDVHRQIDGKLDVIFQDLGRRRLKNIQGEMHLYGVGIDTHRLSPRTYEALTGEPLDLPEQPSIAVLPLENMSNDPEQEYFADGITVDIITAMSRIPGLIVMARTSTFVYKGSAVDMHQVGADLGVRYVLEGSSRKAGNRVRIAVQLADTQTGSHIWSERYDRELDDLFAIQDDITREIVVAMAVNLTHGDEIRAWSDAVPSIEGWDLMMRAISETYRFTDDGHTRAERLFREAIALDPDYPMFQVGLGWCLQTAVRYGFKKDPQAAIAEAQSICDRLLATDATIADAHALKAYVESGRRDFDAAIASAARAVELQPGISLFQASLAMVHCYAGNYEDSLNCMRKAMRLSPYAPDWYFGFLGDAYRGLGELEQARMVYEHYAARMPASLASQTRLAGIHAALGEPDKAKAAVRSVLSIDPTFSVRAHTAMIPFRTDEQRDSFAADLRKAGLPQ